MTDRTVEEYEKFLEVGRWYAHANENNAKELAYLTLGLVGETGEFADAFKKVIRECGFDDDEGLHQLMNRHENHRDILLEELGDVLWYLTNICDYLNSSLSSLMLRNTYKLYTRYKAQGDRYPNQEPIEWPFTDPFKTYDNVQMNLFPQDMEEGRDVC